MSSAMGHRRPWKGGLRVHPALPLCPPPRLAVVSWAVRGQPGIILGGSVGRGRPPPGAEGDIWGQLGPLRRCSRVSPVPAAPSGRTGRWHLHSPHACHWGLEVSVNSQGRPGPPTAVLPEGDGSSRHARACEREAGGWLPPGLRLRPVNSLAAQPHRR